jgi:hypothetical protein
MLATVQRIQYPVPTAYDDDDDDVVWICTVESTSSDPKREPNIFKRFPSVCDQLVWIL